jgi:hypothetical protein
MGSWMGLRSGCNMLMFKKVIYVYVVVLGVEINTNCVSGEYMQHLAYLTYLLLLRDAVNLKCWKFAGNSWFLFLLTINCLTSTAVFTLDCHYITWIDVQSRHMNNCCCRQYHLCFRTSDYVYMVSTIICLSPHILFSIALSDDWTLRLIYKLSSEFYLHFVHTSEFGKKLRCMLSTGRIKWQYTRGI